jgi:hypothetical protein
MHLSMGAFDEFVGSNSDPGDSSFGRLRFVIDDELGIDSPASYRGVTSAVLSRGFFAGNFDDEEFKWGTSPQPPPIAFEILMIPDNLGVPEVSAAVGPDANPAEVLYDLLTSNWGRCALPTSLVDADSFTAAADVLNTEGHGVSFTLEDSSEAGEVIEQLLDQIDGVIYFDPYDGVVKLTLLRQTSPDGMFALDESDILRVESFSSTLWPDTYNQVRLRYLDRASNYRERVHTEFDQANQYFQGRPKALELEYIGVRTAALAASLAARELRFHSIPQAKATLVCKRRASILRPGDPFVWYWDAYGFPFQLVSPGNTTGMIMRVETIDYGSPENPEVRIECIRDLFDLGEPTFSDET